MLLQLDYRLTLKLLFSRLKGFTIVSSLIKIGLDCIEAFTSGFRKGVRFDH